MQGVIMAGGGLVPLDDFVVGTGIACTLASLFVLAGRSLLSSIPPLQQNKVSNLGYYYFMGLCPFLVTICLFSQMNYSFTQSLSLSVLFLLVISIIPYYKKNGLLSFDFFSTSLRAILWVFLIGFLALFLLNVIARDRGGPIYAEASQYIIDTNSLPLINRHFGQSILAAVILRIFNRTDLSLAQMAVNLWLPLSQAFLLLIVYNLTESLVLKKINRLLVCFIAFAGNCALSLLPYIPSDHDFPLICNVYADSVIGLGLGIIVASLIRVLLQNTSLKINQLVFTGSLLYFLFAALNLTSELTILVLVASLVPLFVFSILRKKTGKVAPTLLITALAIILATASANFMGGIFMPKNHVHILEHKNKYLLGDSNAKAAIRSINPTNPSWWYLPYVLPGFYLDFGNYNSIFDGEIVHKSALNDRFLHLINNSSNNEKANPGIQIHYLSTSLLARAMYLAEMRIGTIVKIFFWPLLALVGCIWLLFRVRREENINFGPRLNKNDSLSLLSSKTGISFSIFSFLIALFIIPFNSDPGDILNWRWALTRFNELGLFLMMIYTGIFSVHFLDRIKNSWLRALLTIMLLGVFSSGLLIRLFLYPTLNGYHG